MVTLQSTSLVVGLPKEGRLLPGAVAFYFDHLRKEVKIDPGYIACHLGAVVHSHLALPMKEIENCFAARDHHHVFLGKVP